MRKVDQMLQKSEVSTPDELVRLMSSVGRFCGGRANAGEDQRSCNHQYGGGLAVAERRQLMAVLHSFPQAGHFHLISEKKRERGGEDAHR